MREDAQTAASLVDAPVEPGVEDGRRLTTAALVFLRGRDADARLRELVAGRLALRPVLGKLANEFLRRRLYQAIGYRLGPQGRRPRSEAQPSEAHSGGARETLGMGDRTVREWARVSRELEGLPRLRQAVEAGEVPWSVARKVVGLATPETDAAVLESVRGRTLRAVEAMVRAFREADGKSPREPETEFSAKAFSESGTGRGVRSDRRGTRRRSAGYADIGIVLVPPPRGRARRAHARLGTGARRPRLRARRRALPLGGRARPPSTNIHEQGEQVNG